MIVSVVFLSLAHLPGNFWRKYGDIVFKFFPYQINFDCNMYEFHSKLAKDTLIQLVKKQTKKVVRLPCLDDELMMFG